MYLITIIAHKQLPIILSCFGSVTEVFKLF